jgi:heme-degrading monooxygenase HmoA
MSASPRWHLAQLNIGRVRAPITDPLMAGFVAELESVNALADSAPGFIWRLQTEAGDATAIRPYDDDTILINMSVWETVEALKAYVYRTHHANVMRQREKWFERLDTYFIALWWVPAGTIPTVLEAKLRLDHLGQYGESPYAFSFKKVFPPATESSEAVTISGKTADSA